MSERGRDVLTLVVTLLVLPFIVHMLHAPLDATISVALVSWPIAAALTVLLIVTERERHEERR